MGASSYHTYLITDIYNRSFNPANGQFRNKKRPTYGGSGSCDMTPLNTRRRFIPAPASIYHPDNQQHGGHFDQHPHYGC